MNFAWIGTECDKAPQSETIVGVFITIVVILLTYGSWRIFKNFITVLRIISTLLVFLVVAFGGATAMFMFSTSC